MMHALLFAALLSAPAANDADARAALALAAARPAPVAIVCPAGKPNCNCGCATGKPCTCTASKPDADGWFWSAAHGKHIRYVWVHDDGTTTPCKPGETCSPRRVASRQPPPTLYQPMAFRPATFGGFSQGVSCAGGG